jgi:hypothetical protein
VVVAVGPADLDWLAVLLRLDDLSRPLGVELKGRQGSVAVAAEAASSAPAGGAAAAVSNVAPSTTIRAAGGGGGADAGKVSGSLRLDATAPGVGAVAGWLDAVSADDHFTDVWVDSVSPSASGVSFVGHLSLTEAARSTRPADLQEVAP